MSDQRNPFALLAAYVASLTGPGRTGPGLRRRSKTRTTEVVYSGRHRRTDPPTTTDPKED